MAGIAGLRFETWDVFTHTPFTGNPLAIVWDIHALSAGQMQTIAREFNYSETVFIGPAQQDAHAASLRIFTPSTELPFAGHPTIGAALALKASGRLENASRCILEVPAGPVAIAFSDDPEGQKAWLSPPVAPHVISTHTEDLLPIVGVHGQGQVVTASAGTPFAFLERETPQQVDEAVNGAGLGAFLSRVNATGLYIYAAEAPGHIYARLLAEEIGLTEDPATGSAAAALAAILNQKEAHIAVRQGVQMGRASLIEMDFSDAEEGVRIGGQAVHIMSGQLAAD
ncbi:MAG: PhzF family phenazine biosynthesis protein [Pseudomonadota bacterium]